MLFVMSEELQIVASMQPLDRDVFNYLCERTDYETGVVGKTRKVSYGGIASDLSEPDHGRRAKGLLRKLTSKQVDKSIYRLVEIGLFIRLSKSGNGNNIVLLRKKMADLLVRDKSVQNPEGRSEGRSEGSFSLLLKQIHSKQNNDIRASGDEKNISEGRSEGRSEGTTSLVCCQHIGEQPFAMTLEWKPDESELKAILFRAGGTKFSTENIDPAWLAEFVSYWWAQSGRQYTHRQWTAKLGARLIDYLRDPDLYDQRRGVQQTTKSSWQGNSHVEQSNRNLPGWAQPPRNDQALVTWMLSNGFGEAPIGFDWQQTRGWLRREIDKRMADESLPKIVH